MTKHFWRAGAVALTGGALALAAAMTSALPAQATPSAAAPAARWQGWRLGHTVSTPGKPETLITSIAAPGPADAWAAGFGAPNSGSKFSLVIRHWTGRRWPSVRVPAAVARKFAKGGGPLGRVAASSARNVWDFAALGGKYLRLDGSRWSEGTLPGGFVEVDAALAFSSADVWAFGMRANPRTGKIAPYAVNFDGSSWTRESVPGTGAVISASAVSAGDIWALVSSGDGGGSIVGATGGKIVVQWNGASWQRVATQPTLPAKAELNSIVAQSDTNVWVGGGTPNDKKGTSELAEQWNGSAWTVKSPGAEASRAKYAIEDLTADGSGGLWGLAGMLNGGTSRLWHLSGGTWTQAKVHFAGRRWELAQLTHVPGTKSVWGAGIIAAAGQHADGLIAVDGALPR